MIHIGSHKTATTSFQKMMIDYHDGFNSVANLGQPNHSVGFTTIFSKKPQHYHIWKRSGATKSHLKEQKDSYFSQLDRELGRVDCERLFFSGEDIRLLGASEKSALVNYLQGRGVGVSLAYVAREPMGFATSYSQQLIQRGLKRVTPISLGHGLSLKSLAELIPKRNMMVFDFHELITRHGDAATGLARELGLDPKKQPTYLNQSLSKTPTRLLYQLNKAGIKSDGNQKRLMARQYLITKLRGLIEDSSNDELDTDVLVHALSENSLADARYLRDNFGIDHTRKLPHKTNNDMAESYLAEVEPHTLQELEELFEIGKSRKLAHSNPARSVMVEAYKRIYGEL